MFTNRTYKQHFIASAALALAGVFALTIPAQAQGLTSNPHDLRDAFAAHPAQADSPQAFANFVAQNQALAQRYSRHFSVPQDRLVSFFKASLVRYELPEARTMTTYGVTKAGRIYPVQTTLPKGTPVWATREGVPVLKWNCSNPLASMLPGAALNTPPLEYATAPSPLRPGAGAPELSAPDGFGTAGSASLPGADSFSGSSVAIAPVGGADGFAFAVPDDTGTADSASLPGIGEIVDAGAKSFNAANLLPAALLIPAIMAAVRGGSSAVFSGESEPVLAGGSGEMEPSFAPGSGETLPSLAPVVVPEGNTAGLLLAGLPFLTGAVWLSRRRKTC